jgi:AraC-like DNA-binding protein
MTPRYQEFAVDAALAPHVHCVWSFEASEDGDEQAIPPDGRAELIVHRGAAYEERGDDGRWRAQPMLLFAGQLTRPLVLRSRGAVAVLAMRFTPAGAWAFAGRAMAGCNDRRIALAELHGAAAAQSLAARLAAAPDANAARAALADYVARRIALNDGRRDAAVERCVDRLYASEGRVALAELCALAGVGERQLQRRFAEVVGIAPRTLAGRHPAAPRLRRAARRAVVDVVRARAGGRLLRPPADGARLPPSARPGAFRVGEAARRHRDEPRRRRRLTGRWPRVAKLQGAPTAAAYPRRDRPPTAHMRTRSLSSWLPPPPCRRRAPIRRRASSPGWQATGGNAATARSSRNAGSDRAATSSSAPA